MKSEDMPTDLESALDASAQVVWLQVGQLLDPARRCCTTDAHIVYDASGILYAGGEPPPPGLAGRHTPLQLPDLLALPPLFDAHTHINLCGGELDPEKRKRAQAEPAEQLLAEAENRARTILQRGVVAMRDGGDKDGVGLSLAEKARQGCRKIARVFSPGAGIHREGRYGSFFSRPVEEFATEAACVEARTAAGAEHIKIVPTGIINFAKGAVTARPQFSDEEVGRFKQAAGRCGLKVMAHASGEAGIWSALKGGVDTVEHGYFMTGEQLQAMRSQGVFWVPTFAPVHRQVIHADVMGWDDHILDNLHRILDDHASNLKLAMEMGIEILVGSDAGSYGVPHATGLFEEIWLLSRAGMAPMEALCRAIHDNPAQLTPDFEAGKIEAGRAATFLLASPGVIEDARQLAHASVIIDGSPVCHPDEADLL